MEQRSKKEKTMTNTDRNRIIEIANLLIDELAGCIDYDFVDKVVYAVQDGEKLQKVGK